MIMFTCPNCQAELTRTRKQIGMFWICPSCKGCAVMLPVIRKIVPKEIVNEIWLLGKDDGIVHKRKCLSCPNLMAEVPIIYGDKTEYIDICPTCQLIWFDAGEFEMLPQIPAEPEEKLSAKAIEMMAIADIKSQAYKDEIKDKVERIKNRRMYGRNTGSFGVSMLIRAILNML